CVNTNAVFDRRVTLFSTQPLPGPERTGDERDTLVKFHVCADLCRFTNNDAGAVVDEEMRADLRAGMNIDSGAAMRPLGHYARDQRHLSVKQMRHSINGDRF